MAGDDGVALDRRDRSRRPDHGPGDAGRRRRRPARRVVRGAGRAGVPGRGQPSRRPGDRRRPDRDCSAPAHRRRSGLGRRLATLADSVWLGRAAPPRDRRTPVGDAVVRNRGVGGRRCGGADRRTPRPGCEPLSPPRRTAVARPPARLDQPAGGAHRAPDPCRLGGRRRDVRRDPGRLRQEHRRPGEQDSPTCVHAGDHGERVPGAQLRVVHPGRVACSPPATSAQSETTRVPAAWRRCSPFPSRGARGSSAGLPWQLGRASPSR